MHHPISVREPARSKGLLSGTAFPAALEGATDRLVAQRAVIWGRRATFSTKVGPDTIMLGFVLGFCTACAKFRPTWPPSTKSNSVFGCGQSEKAFAFVCTLPCFVCASADCGTSTCAGMGCQAVSFHFMGVGCLVAGRVGGILRPEGPCPAGFVPRGQALIAFQQVWALCSNRCWQ